MQYVINKHTDKIKISGRYSDVDGGISCDHTGCGVSFNVQCDGRITLDLEIGLGGVRSDAYLEQYFAVFIDGQRCERAVVTGNKNSVTKVTAVICEDLHGRHLIEVFRSNEEMQARMTLFSLYIDGQLLEKPVDKPVLLEFFGDSITAGYGNLSPEINCEDASCGRLSDGTQTFAFLTAMALDADFTAVCASGMAFSYGLGNHPVSFFYTNTSAYRDDNARYDFSGRQPDAVIINLGTNDWDNCPRRGFEFDDIYYYAKPVLAMVRRHRLSSKIVWCYGMMNQGYVEPIKRAVDDMGGEKNGMYFLHLDYDDHPRGGGWHPSLAGHKAAADQLTEFLRQIL